MNKEWKALIELPNRLHDSYSITFTPPLEEELGEEIPLKTELSNDEKAIFISDLYKNKKYELNQKLKRLQNRFPYTIKVKFSPEKKAKQSSLIFTVETYEILAASWSKLLEQTNIEEARYRELLGYPYNNFPACLN